jgi:hypothetical protein
MLSTAVLSAIVLGTPAARGPELLTDAMSQRRAHARTGLVKQFAIALAASLLLVAGGVWWRARATLHDIVAQREALKPSVARALAGEREISTVRIAAQALGRVETDAVVWTDVLRDLFANLPKDASLFSVRTRNDTLLADGVAARGATVFQRLDDGTVLFDGIRPSGTIRREAKRGVAPADRFTLAGKVSMTAPLFATSKKSSAVPMPAHNEELP